MTTDRGYPWLKMYPTWLDEPKFLRLTDGAKARYIELYLLAGKADAGGVVALGDGIANHDDIAFLLHRDIDAVCANIQELEKAGLVTTENGVIFLVRFEEEQGPSHAETREKWKERQDKKRGKYVPPVKDVNQVKDVNKALDLEKEKEEEEEEEEEVTRESRVTTQTPSTSSNLPSFGDMPTKNLESYSSGNASTSTIEEALVSEAHLRIPGEVEEERWNDVTRYALAAREQFGWSRESTIGFIVDNVPAGEFEARLIRDKKNGKKPEGFISEAQRRQAEENAEAERARLAREEEETARMNDPAQRAKSEAHRKDAFLVNIRKSLEKGGSTFWEQKAPEEYKQALAEREAGEMARFVILPDGGFSWVTVPYQVEKSPEEQEETRNSYTGRRKLLQGL